MSKCVFSLLVGNEAGVLSRVAGLFTRRGYNIESLSVGETEDPSFSRMTIATSGDDDVLEQIEKQLGKLIDVVTVEMLPADMTVARELILLKVKVPAEKRQEVVSIATIFRANIVDVAPESLMVELTGGSSKLDAFINLLNGYQILELARTGITALTRGAYEKPEE